MTRQETGQIMNLLSFAYPRYYAGLDKIREKNAVNMWAATFAEDDPRLVVEAVKSFIAMDDKGFPPVPGQIKAKMRLIVGRGETSETEAWDMVRKAVRNSAYDSQAEFEKLPPPIRKLVGRANQLREWSLMDSDTFNSVVSSNFLKAYRIQSAREQEFNALPPDVQALVAEIAKAKAMPELPEKKPEALPPRTDAERASAMPECVRKALETLREGRIPNADGGKGGGSNAE